MGSLPSTVRDTAPFPPPPLLLWPSYRGNSHADVLGLCRRASVSIFVSRRTETRTSDDAKCTQLALFRVTSGLHSSRVPPTPPSPHLASLVPASFRCSPQLRSLYPSIILQSTAPTRMKGYLPVPCVLPNPNRSIRAFSEKHSAQSSPGVRAAAEAAEISGER